MTSGIYISTNKFNGRRYIGYSENIELMRLSSINTLNNGALRNHPLIQSDWNKYGENAFVSGILEVMDTTDQALLSKRSQYWKNLIKPEYNKSKVNTERQLITHEFAILAPVPERHLKSGRTVCKREGKVAFGCSNPNFFDRVDSLREGTEVEVFIYASMSNQSIGAKAS